MHPTRLLVRSFVVLVAAGMTSLGGCAKSNEAPPATAAPQADGKIPITTASEDARKEYLQGRSLAEKLLAQDSIAHFDRAIALDPGFALAELGRANAAPTTREFFEHMRKAASLAGKVSNGERLLILATEAGGQGNAVAQKNYLEQLVAAYPQDERAHFALGGYYFGQQDFPQAVEHYKKATELAPTYSPAYNILGYAFRQEGDYANAEQAFKRYIELIPNDPNPYDSYGELLLKMGKFDDSIAQYRKALAIDPNFMASHLGIAADLMYKGKPAESDAELQQIGKKARSDGDTRTALYGMTVVDVDRGRMNEALKELDRQYALGEKTNDVAAMAGDLQSKGTILLEMGKAAEARALFDRALKTMEDSDLSQQIKDNARVFQHYNLARVALAKKDATTAKSEAAAFREGAEASKNPFQIRQAHELAGTIALQEKQYDTAIAELQQASLQNPYNLYRLGQAYQGKGDTTQARSFMAKAAEFNSLPQLNYAFIRARAERLAGGPNAVAATSGRK